MTVGTDTRTEAAIARKQLKRERDRRERLARAAKVAAYAWGA